MIARDFNNYIDKDVFPHNPKHTDVTLVQKKKDKSDKSNVRLVRKFLNISKIYKKQFHNQLYKKFDSILFPSQCGYCKSGQHCHLDKENEFEAFLTDISKAFHCIYQIGNF